MEIQNGIKADEKCFKVYRKYTGDWRLALVIKQSVKNKRPHTHYDALFDKQINKNYMEIQMLVWRNT